MNLHNNGIVIQATNRLGESLAINAKKGGVLNDEWYQYEGIARYQSWPLLGEFDSPSKHAPLLGEYDRVSEQLTDETHKWWYQEIPSDQYGMPIETATERDFCIRYLNHCRTRGIPTRVLFCQTNVSSPIWGSELPEMSFLGYDRALGGFNFLSDIVYGLLMEPDERFRGDPVYEDMRRCKILLNRKGLFDTEEDLLSFIAKEETLLAKMIRERISGADHWAEDLGDLVTYRLSEVTAEL